MHPVALIGVFAEQQHELQTQRQIVCARFYGPVHEVDVIQGVVARPAVSPAILLIGLVPALNHERPQNRVAVQVHRNRNIGQRRPDTLQHPRGLAHGRVHLRHGLSVAETLGEDAYPQAVNTLFEVSGVILDLDVFLARVQAVRTGHGLQGQRTVTHRFRHRPGMIDRRIEAGQPGMRNQAKGRLEAHNAAPGRRDANRAALVAAHGDIRVAVGDHDRAAV